jgi:hypothetical protein
MLLEHPVVGAEDVARPSLTGTKLLVLVVIHRPNPNSLGSLLPVAPINRP